MTATIHSLQAARDQRDAVPSLLSTDLLMQIEDEVGEAMKEERQVRLDRKTAWGKVVATSEMVAQLIGQYKTMYPGHMDGLRLLAATTEIHNVIQRLKGTVR